MILWVDDVRPPPYQKGYRWVRSVNEAKKAIEDFERKISQGYMYPFAQIELIDLDHDAGDYAYDGGDYIKLLDWLEENGAVYDIRIHSMNPVGRENMRRIIERNGWNEIHKVQKSIY